MVKRLNQLLYFFIGVLIIIGLFNIKNVVTPSTLSEELKILQKIRDHSTTPQKVKNVITKYQQEIAFKCRVKERKKCLLDLLPVMAVESGGDKEKLFPISNAGAVGPMQLMKAAAKDMKVDRWSVSQNISGGQMYLLLLKKQGFHGPCLYIAYNKGLWDSDAMNCKASGGSREFWKRSYPNEVMRYYNAINLMIDKA